LLAYFELFNQEKDSGDRDAETLKQVQGRQVQHDIRALLCNSRSQTAITILYSSEYFLF